MKRSEMLLNIASELVHEYTNFMNFDKAQELAEIVLNKIEKEGMLPPTYKYLNPENTELYKNITVTIPIQNWEPEELFSIDPVEYEKWKKKDNKLS